MIELDGVVQHYAWGSTAALPRVLQRLADGAPWAEYWVGTHHGGPATIRDTGRPLAETAGELGFLAKFLAAAEPLSLQTHPSAEQAAAGFAREEAAGLPRAAPTRLYRDPHAKPEVLIALEPFDALCGFRPVADTLRLLGEIGCDQLGDHLDAHGLAATVEALYRRDVDTAATVASCGAAETREAELVCTLDERYPDDPSVVVTLLLNRVMLQPGEAVYLAPGNVHAYLHGTGVEVMGPSDNVIRGGMTPKHVDVDELLRVIDIAPLADPVVRPGPAAPDGWVAYPTVGAPFTVERLAIADTEQATWYADRAQLVLAVGGPASGRSWYLGTADRFHLAGPTTLFRVG